MLFLLQNGMLGGMFASKWHIWHICTKKIVGRNIWQKMPFNCRKSLKNTPFFTHKKLCSALPELDLQLITPDHKSINGSVTIYCTWAWSLTSHSWTHIKMWESHTLYLSLISDLMSLKTCLTRRQRTVKRIPTVRGNPHLYLSDFSLS